MNKTHVYMICGLPFAGKSTVVRELARQRGCYVIDIDALNTERGVGINGAEIMPEDWAVVFAEARRLLIEALAAGKTIAYDGHVFKRASRDAVRALALSYGGTASVIFVDTPIPVVRERWLANRSNPSRHDVRDDLFEMAFGLMEPPGEDESALIYSGDVPVTEWVAALPQET